MHVARSNEPISASNPAHNVYSVPPRTSRAEATAGLKCMWTGPRIGTLEFEVPASEPCRGSKPSDDAMEMTFLGVA